MRYPGVLWTNGVFLRPHHFQASERYWEGWGVTQQRFDHPFGYGLHALQISKESLAQGVVEISGLQARLKDGTVIREQDSDVHRIPLETQRARLQGGEPLTLYLALPALREGQANVAAGPDVTGGIFRYREHALEVADENSGGDRQTLRVRVPNFRFMLSTDDRGGFETIPIARLRCDTSRDQVLTIDPDYFPPALNLQAWPPLARIVRRTYDEICSRMQTVGRQVRDKRISFSSRNQGDLELLLLLHALNESAGELAASLTAPGPHPLDAYETLCRIVGRVSVFGERRELQQPPHYDHDDLEPRFRWAYEQIHRLIFSLREDEYYQRFFVGAGKGMRVALEPEWFGREWDWFFGVYPINLSQEECKNLLKQIQWVLGSGSRVDGLFARRGMGVTMRRVQNRPRMLPDTGNWLYFAIARDNAEWNQVEIDKTLAMRIKQEQIANLEQLDGQQRLKLAVGNRTYGLEFAIFAVPKGG